MNSLPSRFSPVYLYNVVVRVYEKLLHIRHCSIFHRRPDLLYIKAMELKYAPTYSGFIPLWIANYAAKILHFAVYLTGSSLLCLLSLHRLWFMSMSYRK